MSDDDYTRQRRAELVEERKRELDGVVDRHDSTLRELFHLNKFVTLIGYDPHIAKQEKSDVWETFPRRTRRAITERKESLVSSAAAPTSTPKAASSSSTPKFPPTTPGPKGKPRASILALNRNTSEPGGKGKGKAPAYYVRIKKRPLEDGEQPQDDVEPDTPLKQNETENQSLPRFHLLQRHPRLLPRCRSLQSLQLLFQNGFLPRRTQAFGGSLEKLLASFALLEEPAEEEVDLPRVKPGQMMKPGEVEDSEYEAPGRAGCMRGWEIVRGDEDGEGEEESEAEPEEGGREEERAELEVEADAEGEPTRSCTRWAWDHNVSRPMDVDTPHLGGLMIPPTPAPSTPLIGSPPGTPAERPVLDGPSSSLGLSGVESSQLVPDTLEAALAPTEPMPAPPDQELIDAEPSQTETAYGELPRLSSLPPEPIPPLPYLYRCRLTLRLRPPCIQRSFPLAQRHRVATLITRYWDRKQGAAERLIVAEERRVRAGAKALAKGVVAKAWKDAVAVIRARIKEQEEAEQAREGRKHLAAILEQSSALLETSKRIWGLLAGPGTPNQSKNLAEEEEETKRVDEGGEEEGSDASGGTELEVDEDGEEGEGGSEVLVELGSRGASEVQDEREMGRKAMRCLRPQMACS
ncbi:hypothetical protein RhiJN_12299 [Ceratobasidium sp. AG-Ba]|nr:hypothetical protein RhiJN_12299 [Ceratobasidium sp. AG-Ba]